MLMAVCMLCVVAGNMVTILFFRVLARQEHEALKLQTRHNDQLVASLVEHLPTGSGAAESATALVRRLRAEMRALRERHQDEARWLFRRFDDAALSKQHVLD